MAAASSFAALDYVVLTGLLALSAGIGAFFAWRDRRGQSNRQFLTANKQLGWLPVSASMVASVVSAIAILGLPSQVFVRGSTLWMYAVSSTLAILMAAFVFLPMYYNMDISSINEDSAKTTWRHTTQLEAYSNRVATNIGAVNSGAAEEGEDGDWE
ncbi:sodium-coupled monocarboxylate transporter 2-like [Dermacentor albipictus]|uniref:sodium-coupled monocarboxylate transporter 2-like n=1 Tax=Dermacentor albipictus TaxID=60249 RepID=UPI0038FC96A6